MNDRSTAHVVEAVIRARRTEKVLCEVADRQRLPDDVRQAHDERVLQALETAGWAPFHYPRPVDDLVEPWRAHVLTQDAAHKLAVYLQDELQLTTKEPRLAAACSALVVVTWLPEFYDPGQRAASALPRDKQIARDEEHLAAASAMVQNLLLMLTAHGMGTYWSSGGRLRHPDTLAHLGASPAERFLAAIFIEYPEAQDAERLRKPGSLRDRRGDGWIRHVEL